MKSTVSKPFNNSPVKRAASKPAVVIITGVDPATGPEMLAYSQEKTTPLMTINVIISDHIIPEAGFKTPAITR